LCAITLDLCLPLKADIAMASTPRSVQAVPTAAPTSDSEPGEALLPQSLPFKRVRRVALGCGLLALVVGAAWLRSSRTCSKDLWANWLEEKMELDGEGQMRAAARKLNSVSSQSAAQRMVEKVMKTVREAPDPVAAPARELPNSFVLPADPDGVNQGTAQCIFNVVEAMALVIGLGDDINAVIRTCPSPRGPDSELACQVDSALMVAYIGTIAAKLSLAASNCAESANIDSICAAGVTGIVGALGELAAAASLAAPTCSPHPPALPTTKISELGDQTLERSGRRLAIGQGAVGNGVQCSVDVSIVAANIANLGLAINQAVHSTNCDPDNINANSNGLKRALCTVDIGGAIAYFGQVVTFTQLAILNCKDFLDIKALCGASIAGIATAAAAIAPYGAAIHAACALKGQPRRLEDRDDRNPVAHMNEVMRSLQATMAELGMNATAVPGIHNQNTASEADLRKLVNLMEPAMTENTAVRGAGPFKQECK